MTLSDKGMVIRSEEEIVEEMNTRAKTIFGENVKLDSHHVLGQIIQVNAEQINHVEQGIGESYKQSHPSTATGVNLDQRGVEAGQISRLPASLAQVILTIKGTPNYVVQEETNFATEDGQIFFLVDSVLLEPQMTTDSDGNQVPLLDDNDDPVGMGTGLAVSDEHTSNANVPANTITVNYDTLEDITSVTNEEAAEGGAAIEVDSDYRQRILSALQMQPGPPVQGVQNGLMSIKGVRQVKLIENNLMEVDEYGNPPKTIHIYTLGGFKDDVIAGIGHYIAAGVTTTGDQSGQAADAGGTIHTYKFSYAESLPVHLKINVTTNDDWDSDNGEQELKDKLTTYIKTLNMADKLYFSKLYQFVYSIAGISIADIQLGTNPDNLGSTDITPSEFEVITLTEDDIEVKLDE